MTDRNRGKAPSQRQLKVGETIRHALAEIFARGEDIHAATAAEVLGSDPKKVSPGERSKAKMVNYGIAYGLSAYGLADRLNIEQDEAAAEYVMSVNGGNQTVPTVVFPDGTALTNPSAAQVKAQLAAIAG